MSNFFYSRAFYMYIFGIKLLDVTVTYINCGMIGKTEHNPILLYLVQISDSWLVTLPYLILWAPLSIGFCHYGLENDSVFGKVALEMGYAIAIMSIWGPLSHLIVVFV